MYLISRQRSCLNVYTVICSCSYGSSACRTSQFICPLSCLTTHTVAACISVCFFMRNGDKEAERKSVWVCVRARSCISASPRVCILVFKLTHPDTALQRLDPHVNVCHLKLLIFQRWLIFFFTSSCDEIFVSVKYSINRINLFSAATCNFCPIVEMSHAQ